MVNRERQLMDYYNLPEGTTVGGLINQVRLEKNLTFLELSRRTGIGGSTLCRFEHGERIPDVKHIDLLSRELEIPRDVLFELSSNAVLKEYKDKAASVPVVRRMAVNPEILAEVLGVTETEALYICAQIFVDWVDGEKFTHYTIIENPKSE